MRFFACAFLAIATIHATKACTPGEKQQDGPNTCFCLGDGLGWVCAPGGSSPLAIPRIELLREKRQVEDTKDSCEPGSYFRSYCNSCRCADDGKISNSICTMKGCLGDIWNEDGSLKNPEEVFDNTLVRKERQVTGNKATCEPGQTFKSWCNTCQCGSDGLVSSAACTRKYCSPLFWNEDGTPRIMPMIPGMEINPLARETRDVERSSARCVPGTVFKYYCNTCACGDDGLAEEASCTRMRCDPEEWNEDGTPRILPMKPGMEINPLVRATRDVESSSARCVPGTVFKYYCNTCACGDDGLAEEASCTRMRCDPEEWNEDGTRKYFEEDETNVASPVNILTRLAKKVAAAPGTCVPGSTFKYYCNDCYCLEDGLLDNASCTRKLCDRNEYNEDGSRKYPEEENETNNQYEDLDDSNEHFLDPTPVKKDKTNHAGQSDVSTRQAKEVATAPGTCVPGSTFKYYCNDCYCLEDGLLDNASCSRMLCDRNEYNEDGSRKYPEEENETNNQYEDLDDSNEHFLDPTPVKKDKTNHASQSDVSTRQAKDLDDSNDRFLDPNPIHFPSFKKREAEEGRCRTGEVFRNYCNYCFCGTDGIIARSPCTEMVCDLEVWNKDGTKKSEVALLRNARSVGTQKVCEPNSTFRKDCNTCTCNEDGTSAACTLKGCIQSLKKKVCEPNSTFKKDCNTCTCNEDGTSAACTLKGCIQSLKKKVCEPNSTFKKDCNTCTCNEDGTSAACTLKGCIQSLKKKVCEPNSTFKKDCNTCTCNEDGTSAACTLKGCIQSLKKKVCEPNSTYKPDSCNSCTCNGDGTSAVCTLMDCLN